MSKKKKNELPYLRFPEFKDSEWIVDTLGNIGEFTGGGTPTRDNDSYWQGHIPWISSSDISEDSITEIQITRFITEEGLRSSATKVVPPNSILLVSRVGVGKLAVSKESVCTSQDFTNFTPNKDNLFFLAYYLKSRSSTLLQYSQGMAIKGFTKDDISKLELLLPKSKKEQQKIADCLFSLDELITAENQKLEALQQHKKGLMQQLFPADGEKVPKLRFKEFRNCGEWEEKPLGSLVEKVGSGVTPLGGEANYKKSGRPFVRSQNVGWGIFLLDDIAFIDEETHQDSVSTEIKTGDVLLNITGASIGRSAVANELVNGGNVNQHVCIIRTIRTELNAFFLNQYLVSSYGQEQIDSFQAGGNRQGLNFAQIRSFSIPIPSKLEEQQKIADCFSSLNGLITEQSQGIEILKAHKKGLLQQLFPNIN